MNCGETSPPRDRRDVQIHDESRRRLLGGLLLLCGQLLGCGRRKSVASPSGGEATYRPLDEKVMVPLAELEEPWHPVAFKAWTTRRGPDRSRQERLLRGFVLRTPAAGEDDAQELRAYCRLCPHELCFVDFVADTRTVRVEGGPKPPHPLLVCPCHFSVFDPLAEGACISGPAPRGLYRFSFSVIDDRVEIGAVENAAAQR